MPKAKAKLFQAIIDDRVPFLTHRTAEGKSLLTKFIAHIHRTGMTNLGQSKRELALQELADNIYGTLHDGKKCPYRIFLTAGYTDHLYQAIHLMGFNKHNEDDLDTLCHEIAHIDNPGMGHGKRFKAKVDKLMKLAKEFI